MCKHILALNPCMSSSKYFCMLTTQSFKNTKLFFFPHPDCCRNGIKCEKTSDYTGWLNRKHQRIRGTFTVQHSDDQHQQTRQRHTSVISCLCLTPVDLSISARTDSRTIPLRCLAPLPVKRLLFKIYLYFKNQKTGLVF